MTDLPKTFDPAEIEARWYAHWEENGLFRPERPDAVPFTIVNPPPNVTGSLHIGHALDNTLQDVVIRYERLRGKDALWVVGTDHAGIATQMVVERQLNAAGQKRTDFTRDQFVEKVWEWKAESGGAITRQLRRLGCSMDWANERFTMDEGFSKAVVKVFVELHQRGLLYRDKRLVNWDPHFRSAISDLEVETKETNGKFWHFSYPLEDGSGTISVATTRPETMLADMAVAVNPTDERYAALVGKKVRLPITGRLIPIVTDDYADPELGSGAVKITPGHDFNDFEVGKRAGFKAGEMLNMLDADANVCQTGDGLIPPEFIGLHRFKRDAIDGARELVVSQMTTLGLIEKIEDRVIQTPYGDRSGVVIEPWLTDQWYVDADTLARPAIEAVKSGAIEIVPKTWEKTWFNWMENIQPWCVSRQLWWGHQIPAWFGPAKVPASAVTEFIGSDLAIGFSRTEDPMQLDPQDNQCFVAENEDDAWKQAKAFYGEKATIKFFESKQEFLELGYAGKVNFPETIPLWRDPDVLDTWFSSALWPFATLGWPEDAAKVDRYYPNDLLISGFDILFFWDARMAMQGIEFMKEVPWKKLYLHGLVRAADGQKMSKSKGNVVDPLGLIDQFGADALRFFMAAMESQGRDVKMDEKRVEGYRNFATKLWNATRFAMSNGIGASSSVQAPPANLPVNKWIIGEVVETVATLDKAMAELRFDAAANAIYYFVWNQFCDWYLERIKPTLTEEEALSPHGAEWAKETRDVAGWVLDQILVMLHPFMPFITEELWAALGARERNLIVSHWPDPKAGVDEEAKASIEWFIKLVGDTRAAKNELGIAPGSRLTAYVRDANGHTQDKINQHFTALRKLARLDIVTDKAPPVGASIQIVVDEATFVLPLEGVIDLAAEKARLAKALAGAEKERDSLAGRLSNAAFVEKAKPEAIAKAREDHADKTAEADRLKAALDRLA